MAFVGIFLWWYTAGWKQQVSSVRERLAGLYDYFSIDLLVRTLFSPYRQISAGRVRGPIGIQLRAFLDRLISRIIGSIVRTIMIVIGSVTLFLTIIFGLFTIIAWAFVPALPIIGVALALSGWVPWR